MQSSTKKYPTLPPDASLFTRAWVGAQAIKVLMKDPAEPVYGNLFQDALDGAKYAAMARRFQEHPEGRHLLTSRPNLDRSRVDFEALGKLPPGTLGHAFASFYKDKPGVDPIFSLEREMTDGQYVAKRMRESHDLHHLLTGYGTDMLGEMELQAFQFGNLRTPTSVFAMLAGLSDARVTVPRREYLRRLWAAFRRGRASRPIVSILWEEHFTTPLKQFQEAFCAPMQPAPSRSDARA